MSWLCRDCFTTADTAPTGGSCRGCGSPRGIAHDELSQLSLAHLDCDAFYASVEKRDNPSLADKPLIIGGGTRGVVSTACYVARMYGVRSAMPMFKALKACPDAVVLKPDMKKYVAASREIRALMLDLTPLVEPLSIDEAFLDLTGTARVHHATPAAMLARLAANVEREVGVSISVGLSYNKFLAKLASDLDKPRGFAVIGATEAVDFLARRPVSDIYGVGKAFHRKLDADGVRLIGDFRKFTEADLMRRYGAIGKRLHAFAHGRDARDVSPDNRAKSVSSETTFNTDLRDAVELAKHLWRLSENVSADLKRKDMAARTVTLKLRAADFSIRTRSRTLENPTQLAGVLFDAAAPMMRIEADGHTAFRLIGVGGAGLMPGETADAPDLLDTDRQHRKKIETALDQVRARYGKTSIGEGRGRKDG